MRVRRAIWMPGLFAVLALVLAACGGSDPTATTSPTSTPGPTATTLPTSSPGPTATAASQESSSESSAVEQEYLRAVRAAQLLTNGIFMRFQNVFYRSYPLREVLLTALLENGIGTPFIGNLAALEELNPPSRFQEDHRIWLEAIRESLRLDTEAADAVREGDLVKFVHINGNLSVNVVRARLALSPVFCRNTAINPSEAAFCALEGTALAGEYETGINNLLREFMPLFASTRATLAFRLSLTPEEIGQVLTSMGDTARLSLESVQAGLRTMTPSDGLLADHERMQTYFNEVLETIQEVERLRENGDLNEARLTLQSTNQSLCEARESFESSDFKEAVAIYFSEGTGACRRTPFVDGS